MPFCCHAAYFLCDNLLNIYRILILRDLAFTEDDCTYKQYTYDDLSLVVTFKQKIMEP